MLRTFLKSKIHRAAVTETNINYDGSLTLDPILMEKSDIQEFEKVLVVNINNGIRFDTYVIKGKKNSGEICINGAAARLAQNGDVVIIMSFAMLDEKEMETFKPIKLTVSPSNQPL